MRSKARRFIEMCEQGWDVKMPIPSLEKVLDGWVTHTYPEGGYIEFVAPNLPDGKIQTFADGSWVHKGNGGEILMDGKRYKDLVAYLQDHFKLALDEVPEPAEQEEAFRGKKKREVYGYDDSGQEKVCPKCFGKTGKVDPKCSVCKGTGWLVPPA